MKRGAGWPAAVVIILGVTVAANLWIIRVANNDPSFAVEEDYYQRGVHWDDELAQRRLNDSLGWRLQPSLSAIVAGRGAELRVVLRDAGDTIGDASIVVRAVHVARANQPVQATLQAGRDGAYVAHLPMERAGLWELRFDVHRGADRFTATERLDARLAPP